MANLPPTIARKEWVHQSLRGGWQTLKREPIGILLPAAGALLMHVAAGMIVRSTWGVELTRIVLVGLAVTALVRVAGAVFRAPMIAAAARALDLSATGVARAPQLAIVELLTTLAQLIASAIIVVPLSVATTVLAARGLHLLAALCLSVAAIGGTAIVLLVRATFAYAPAIVLVSRKDPIRALIEASKLARGDWLQLALLLFLGDALTGFGGLLCGAGALPGYPMGDLAVLHRWARRSYEAQ